MLNPTTRQMIVEHCQLAAGETVWEIGPGLGALTQLLLQKPIKLTVWEIDSSFCRILRQEYSQAVENGRLTIIAGDFFSQAAPLFNSRSYPDCIVGNLPYYCGAAMIGELIRNNVSSRLFFTLQWEAARRLTAPAGSRDTTPLAIFISRRFQAKIVARIGGGDFFPQPRVASALLSLEPLPCSAQMPSFELKADGKNKNYYDFVDSLFAQRRKTIRNNLAVIGFAVERLPEAQRQLAARRAETLSLNEIDALWRCYRDVKAERNYCQGR